MTPIASFYTGPGRSRLHVSTWEDLDAAVKCGAFEENQWVELKKDIPASSKSANLELARDLASLSLDGGLLIVGVTDGCGELVGTELGGLDDRIGQVAASRISPPLPVTTYPFDKPGSVSSVGALIVSVPASQDAPHMVDDRYWGRGTNGKQPLGDSAVRRLLADQKRRAEGFELRLRELAEQLDPLPLDDRRHGHLYLLLEPSAGSAGTPLSQAMGNSHFMNLVHEGVSFEPQWSPSWRQLQWGGTHPEGIAGSSADPSRPIFEETTAISVLMCEDGAVQVASGAGAIATHDLGGLGLVSVPNVLELVHSTAQMAAHIATKYVEYEGAWRAGIFLDRLRGARPRMPEGTFEGAPFPRAEHVRVISTTTQELRDTPEQFVATLTGPLVRGLGVHRRYLPYSSPEEIHKRHTQ